VLQNEPSIVHNTLVDKTTLVRVVLANQIRHCIRDTLNAPCDCG
jgi:hypothetical protein